MKMQLVNDVNLAVDVENGQLLEYNLECVVIHTINKKI